MRESGSAIAFFKGLVLVLIVELVIVSFLRPPQATSTATLEGISIGVYWDANCTMKVESIDWGSLYPGSLKPVEVHVRNEGNTTVSIIQNTTDWVPSEASNYMNLNWNYTRQIMNPGNILPVTFRLSVSPQIRGITSFSFSIVLSPAFDEFDVAVRFDARPDQENYVVADVVFDASESLIGGLGGYILDLSVPENVTVIDALAGGAFNVKPTVDVSGGKVVLSALGAGGVQMQGLSVMKLRLRLSGMVGVECAIQPLSLTVVDAVSGDRYNATVHGWPFKLMRGDANSDGQVTVADAMFIAQYLAGTRSGSALNLLNAASVKHDGEKGDKVTIADAMFILQYLVGQRDGYFELKQ